MFYNLFVTIRSVDQQRNSSPKTLNFIDVEHSLSFKSADDDDKQRSIHLIPPRPPFLLPLYSNFLFVIQFNGELPKSPAAKTLYKVGGFVLCSCATFVCYNKSPIHCRGRF